MRLPTEPATMASASPDHNPFGTRGELTLDEGRAVIFRLGELERKGVGAVDRLPFSIRVLLENAQRHDVPCVVDLAAMRDAMARMGGDPGRINPVVPCDLVIDHSVQVDHYGTAEAFRRNVALEFDRNAERYQLLKFAQRAFRNFRVVPPGTGIVHQVNLEYLVHDSG